MNCHGTHIIDKMTNRFIAIAAKRENGTCKCFNVPVACNGSTPNALNA